MKTFLISVHLILLFPAFTVIGQQRISGKIENAGLDKPAMDIVLFMFGMDHPVKVGEADSLGNISVSFPDELPVSIPSDTKSMFGTQLRDALYFSCFDIANVPDTIKNITMYKGGYFALAHKNRPWAGTLFSVSDKELIPWLEDRYYKNPVTSSFFEVIYSEQAINLTTTCKDNVLYAEGNEIMVEYRYALQLKKGFNLVEYKIEALKQSGSPDIPSIPEIVTITTAKNTDTIQWYAKYFYSQFN